MSCLIRWLWDTLELGTEGCREGRSEGAGRGMAPGMLAKAV